MINPTPYPDVNLIIDELLNEVQAVLGSHLFGMYLDGSLASGDFDQDSDIDFVVVTDQAITEEQFTALQARHDRLARLDSPWAIQLEGYYLSRQAANQPLREHDQDDDLIPVIERGQGERLKWVPNHPGWVVHQAMLHTRGITLVGPPPHTLIDPVSPAQLREAMRSILAEWAIGILKYPAKIKRQGYQSYVVLSLCRILYTLQHGQVASKRAAARWAQETLGGRFMNLIENAWEGRHHPDRPAAPQQMQETLEFIRYTLES